MRLSFFLIVVVATFIVGCISFSNAENPAFVPQIDHGARQLRLSPDVQEERAFGDVVKTAAKLGDDQALKLAKILTNSEKARAAFLVSDDKIARMSTLIKKANAEAGVADDEVAKLAKVFAAAQKSAKATDDQVFSITKIMANAKKVDTVVKVSDDEVRKVSEMFKIASSGATGAAKYTDEHVAKLSKALAEAQKGAAVTGPLILPGSLGKSYSPPRPSLPPQWGTQTLLLVASDPQNAAQS